MTPEKKVNARDALAVPVSKNFFGFLRDMKREKKNFLGDCFEN